MKVFGSYKKVMAFVMAASMLMSLAACGKPAKEGAASTASGMVASKSTAENTAPAAKEPITLKVFGQSDLMTSGGVQNDPVSLQIAKVTGVTLENIPGDKDKLKILAAGGDLPDIIQMHESPALCKSFISSQIVIPLDDLLQQYGKNIVAAIPTALKASKLVLTPSKDKTYFIPTNIQKADPNNPQKNGFVGFYTRWDVYKSVGMPEIKNDDDYLNVLKKMVDSQPKTKDGKKVYALSGWIDWGLWPYTISYPFAHGYTNSNDNTSVKLDTMEKELHYTTEDNIFWTSLKFFNKAYQLGIFDPEAFTMKYPQYDAKVKTGQVLVSAAQWIQPDKAILGDSAAMYIIPGTNPYIAQICPEDNLIGYMGTNPLAISSGCKYPERAMEVLDYCNSDEGARWIHNGSKGVDWNIEGGNPVLLGKLLENAMSGGVKEADYTKPGNVNGIGRYGFLVVQDSNNPALDGIPLRITNSSEYKVLTAQPMDKDFAQKYGGTGAVYPGQAYMKMLQDGLAKKVPTSYPMAAGLVEPLSDESGRIVAKADQYMNASIAKFILAKTDTDFEQEKQKAIADFKAMGMEKAYAESMEKFIAAKKLAEEINK